MKLYKRDLEFLRRNLKNAILLSKFELCSLEEHDVEGHTIHLTEEELDMLEDELTRVLWEIGTSSNNEVNAQGLYIERLIDIVRNEYDE